MATQDLPKNIILSGPNLAEPRLTNNGFPQGDILVDDGLDGGTVGHQGIFTGKAKT